MTRSTCAFLPAKDNSSRARDPRFCIRGVAASLLMLCLATGCLGPTTVEVGDAGFEDEGTGDTLGDPRGGDTSVQLCGQDQRVLDGRCVDCPLGTANEAGDPVTAPETLCDVVLCEVNHRVEDHRCVPCEGEALNGAGDNAMGDDTLCDEVDVCQAQVGLSCAAFDEAYLKASNTGEYDNFGVEVAISGDTIAVAATGESSAQGADQTDNSASNAGAVYVFRRTGNTWAQEALLKASNADGGFDVGLAGDGFGIALALEGDTLVVGAWDEDSVSGEPLDNSGHRVGAAYVFERSGTTWTETAYLKAEHPDSSDAFGYSVALSGDTIAIGAPFEAGSPAGDGSDNGLIASGAVFIFERDAGSWSQSAYLKASNADADDLFGTAVGLSDDLLVVGAPEEDGSSRVINLDEESNMREKAGAAYVFRRSGGTWTQEAYLKASNADPRDRFGSSVAVDGTRIAVAAVHEASSGPPSDNSAASSGAVYLFQYQAGSWTQEAYLKSSVPGAGDLFGTSVALDGELLLIGAEEEDGGDANLGGDERSNASEDAGAVYAFRLTSFWVQVAYLKSPAPDPQDNLGAVALDAGTMVLGAWREQSDAVGVDGDPLPNVLPFAGAAFVRRIRP